MSSQVTGQVCGGGAARDFIKDRNTGANPAACTATVTATRTAAMSMAESMVRGSQRQALADMGWRRRSISPGWEMKNGSAGFPGLASGHGLD